MRGKEVADEISDQWKQGLLGCFKILSITQVWVASWGGY